MDASVFTDYWRRNYPDCPPVSYLFKQRLGDRWFRFHNLPASKRYADNYAEIKEVLTRQNTVLLDVIGEGKECSIIIGDYSESPGESINSSGCPILARYSFHGLPSLPKQEFDSEPLIEGEFKLYLRLGSVKR